MILGHISENPVYLCCKSAIRFGQWHSFSASKSQNPVYLQHQTLMLEIDGKFGLCKLWSNRTTKINRVYTDLCWCFFFPCLCTIAIMKLCNRIKKLTCLYPTLSKRCAQSNFFLLCLTVLIWLCTSSSKKFTCLLENILQLHVDNHWWVWYVWFDMYCPISCVMVWTCMYVYIY